jgi:DNA-binding transcriptional ArsR family regulator
VPEAHFQPAVSKHLAALRKAGLVRDRHEGRQTHYSAEIKALAPLIDWTNQMAGFWESKFDTLEDLLKRMDQ